MVLQTPIFRTVVNLVIDTGGFKGLSLIRKELREKLQQML